MYGEYGGEEYKQKVNANLPSVVKLLGQLRAISPVPKSFANIDRNIGRFVQSAQSAISMIRFGLEQNNPVPVSVAQEDLSEAFGQLDKIADELKLRTAPVQQGKKYVDG